MSIKQKRRTSTEFGCYRVTIEDPIVSGPGQEWDQEWAVPHSKGTVCNVQCPMCNVQCPSLTEHYVQCPSLKGHYVQCTAGAFSDTAEKCWPAKETGKHVTLILEACLERMRAS